MKHMFHRFDRILLTKTCSSPRWRIAALNSGNKTALIGIGIYIRIKSVRHSVAWLSSRHQSDPRWEPFSRSETLIDTLGNAVWHHMRGFKSKNPHPHPALIFNWPNVNPFIPPADHLWWVQGLWAEAELILSMLTEKVTAFRAEWPNERTQCGGTSG